MRGRRTGPVVVAAMLAMAVAGCSRGQPSGTEALDAPQSASAAGPSTGASPSNEAPAPAASATATAPTTPAAPRGGHVLGVHQFAVAIRNAVSTYHSVHVSMRMTGSTAMRAEGDVRYTAHGPLMRLRMQMPELGTGTMRLRMVGGMVYLAMPPMTPRGRWVAIDPSDPNSALGPSAGALTKINPMQSFMVIEKGVRKLRYVGRDTVQGEPAFHYRVTVDTRAAANVTGQPANPMLPRMVGYDIWLDRQNRMRRMRLDELGVTIVSNLSDWGVPVHVQAPPPSRVLTMGSSGA